MPASDDDNPWATTRYQKRQQGLLDPEEFQDTLSKVLGTHEFDEQFDTLFTKVGLK